MEALPEVEERRLVIAVDYGTTYTGVAIATPVGNRAVLNEISIVDDWGPNMGNHPKIPSVISYSLRSPKREQQWGTDLSPQAIAMVHTKLQLDVDDTSTELDLILQALDGMQNLKFQYIKDSGRTPKYTLKGPEEIVEDYLTNVFDYLLRHITQFTEELRRRIPVDIVATIPAEWTYRAKNSTFRALSRAGFNRDTFPGLQDMLLVSEPEAAAIYTARMLKEKYGADFLRKDECFVLCDAGGGTVDVVSYRVKQLEPTFEIEAVTVPTGDKCGSIFINIAFKRWLRNLLGDTLYQELDEAPANYKISSHDSEGQRMRELIQRFDVHKRKFGASNRDRDIKLDLPEPYQDLNLDTRVRGGEITIPYKEMESFFERCADGIVGLIQGQIEQIESLRVQNLSLRIRLKNVFLVGGFAESEYLQESIKESLDMRHLELRRPDTSWTAVVRGAAIFGIEKSANKSLATMNPCIRSYGIPVNKPFSGIENNTRDLETDVLTRTSVAKEQLLWLIKKGDLILSTQPKEVKGVFNFNFTETGPKTGRIPIYAYDGDKIPDRLSDAQGELHELHAIQYDLKDIPLQEFPRPRLTDPSSPRFFIAELCLTVRLAPQIVHVELHLRERLIYSAAIPEP